MGGQSPSHLDEALGPVGQEAGGGVDDIEQAQQRSGGQGPFTDL